MIFPLRLKLALLTSTLLVAGIGTVSWLLDNQYSGALEEEARKRGRSIAEGLSRNAPLHILDGDDVVIGNMLAAVAEESEVVGARLLDKSGRVIASTFERDDKTELWTDVREPVAFHTTGWNLLVASRMTFDDKPLGEAQVELDRQAIVDRVVERSRRDLLVASGGLLLVGVLIAFATSGLITRPLSRLRVAVRALAKGDTSARVEVTTRDEVADLTRAFNDMSASLSEKSRVESAFRRYVSDHVLQQVRERPGAVPVLGERRDITVLFIDIRQFTRLASGTDPEALVAFLNEAFELITERLLQHGATVDKYMGDAILAYFGAPIDSSDHLERAVAAAIAVQRSVEERNKACKSAGESFQRLDLGIGIQTGPVVIGNIGSELKMDYTIIGDPVNVANRLQKLARPGEIMITGDVAARLGDRARLESIGTRQLEGRDEPVSVLRVLY